MTGYELDAEIAAAKLEESLGAELGRKGKERKADG